MGCLDFFFQSLLNLDFLKELIKLINFILQHLILQVLSFWIETKFRIQRIASLKD
jgi:hypothetical protein